MKKQKDHILIINSGSSTLKFKIFHQADLKIELNGIVEKIGLSGSFINISENTSRRIIMKNYPSGIANHQEALKEVMIYLKHWKSKIKIIGHRVVHGGSEFTQPTIINDKILKKLEKFGQLAPLHNPINLLCIKTCIELIPGIKNIAVFDTAFYKTIPDYAYLYPIPWEYYKNFNIRRYGFHGISHQYLAEQTEEKIKKPLKKIKLITCHLGSGCSITAIKFGQAIETSMGFTPLEGIMMSTRSGDIDPSIPIYLIRHLNMSLSEIEELLNKKSGLLGIFNYSKDMRDVMIAAGYRIPGYQPPKKFTRDDKIKAKLALKMFIYRIVKYIGGYAMIMGGVDYIVFTGGIGERNATIRNLIIKEIKKSIKKVKTMAIPANEELMIAREVKKIIK